jgi:hypothetical protein
MIGGDQKDLKDIKTEDDFDEIPVEKKILIHQN